MIDGDVDHPWDEKVEVAFYRGQMTGADFDTHDAKLEKTEVDPELLKERHISKPEAFPRLEILRLSTERPDMVDAAYIGAYPGLREQIPTAFARDEVEALKGLWPFLN